MKNHHVFILILFLIFTVEKSAYGQFKLGVKTGINLSKADFDDTSTQLLFSFNGGFFSEIDLGKKFFLRPELLYSLKGWSPDETQGNGSIKLNLHYFNIPLMIGYKPIPKLALLAGPELGFLMKAERKPAVPGWDPNNTYEKFDFGISLGSSYSILKKLSVEIRYTYGFDMLIKAEGRDINNNPTGEKFKDGANRVFQFNVLYTLWSK